MRPKPSNVGFARTVTARAPARPANPEDHALTGFAHPTRSVYCSARAKRAEIAVGLAASWEDLVRHRRVQPRSILPPIEGSVITMLAPAEEAVKAGGTDVVGISWKQCPIRAASAASVLTAPDFLGQVEQALEYTRATAEHFRRVGYLRDTR